MFRENNGFETSIWSYECEKPKATFFTEVLADTSRQSPGELWVSIMLAKAIYTSLASLLLQSSKKSKNTDTNFF
jgi:hypothetical protein